jgi:hypothetical protein
MDLRHRRDRRTLSRGGQPMNPPNRRPIRGDRVNRLVSTWHCEPARGQQIRHHPTRPMHSAAAHSYQPTEPAHDVHEHRRRARPLPGKLAAAWRDPVAPDHSRCNTRIRPIPRAAAPAPVGRGRYADRVRDAPSISYWSCWTPTDGWSPKASSSAACGQASLSQRIT